MFTSKSNILSKKIQLVNDLGISIEKTLSCYNTLNNLIVRLRVIL